MTISQSPSSVRWHDNMTMMWRNNNNPTNNSMFDKPPTWDMIENDSDHTLSEAWNIPDAAEMQRRLEFRREIREETLQHRKIHRHGGIVGGRNIARVLLDREWYGAHTRKHTQYYQWPKTTVDTPQPHDTSVSDGISNRDGCHHNRKLKTRTMSTTSAPASTTAHVSASASASASAPPASSAFTARGGELPPLSGSTNKSSSHKRHYYQSSMPFPGTISNEIRTFAEYYSVVRYHSAFFQHLGGQDAVINGQRPSSSQAISTISVAFAPDTHTMASTHGDHTVKITCTHSGHLVQTLEGHPRTPWTVKYHPIDSSLLASGCLGHQVRLWNWKTASCLHMIRLEFAIISLSFHPTGNVLAIANGTRLHFWSLDGLLPKTTNSNENENENENENHSPSEMTTTTTPASTQTDSEQQQQQQPRPSRGILTEVEQRHMLRCVHFPPGGTTIIVGGVNQTPDPASARGSGRRNNNPNGMSFYLRLFDFDLDVALRPNDFAATTTPTNQGYRRRVISNPRTFVPRALLYNDGGFDVSPDGKTLCACAEYWLPDGVENAMELLYPQQDDDDDDDDKSDDKDDAMEDPRSTAVLNVPQTTATNSTTDNEANPIASSTATTPIPEDSTTEDHPQSTTPDSFSPPRHFTGPPTTTSGNNNTGGHVTAAPPLNVPSHSSSSLSMAMAMVNRSNNPLTPQTPPPNAIRAPFNLSPPSPPGRRFAGGLNRRQQDHYQQQQHQVQNHQYQQEHMAVAASSQQNDSGNHQSNDVDRSVNEDGARTATDQEGPNLGPPPPQPAEGTAGIPRTDHPLAPPPPPPSSSFQMMTRPIVGTNSTHGRFVPHVVTISLDTSPLERQEGRQQTPPNGTSARTTKLSRTTVTTSKFTRPRLGSLLEACPLDGAKASAVTCVKFSPSTNFCLIGYGVREPLVEHNGNRYHPVTALYRVRGGMTHVSTMLSGDDDVNIARFHPSSGYGFVYGTKQGRVRVLSPRPWNFYNC